MQRQREAWLLRRGQAGRSGTRCARSGQTPHRKPPPNRPGHTRRLCRAGRGRVRRSLGRRLAHGQRARLDAAAPRGAAPRWWRVQALCRGFGDEELEPPTRNAFEVSRQFLQRSRDRRNNCTRIQHVTPSSLPTRYQTVHAVHRAGATALHCAVRDPSASPIRTGYPRDTARGSPARGRRRALPPAPAAPAIRIASARRAHRRPPLCGAPACPQRRGSNPPSRPRHPCLAAQVDGQRGGGGGGRSAVAGHPRRSVSCRRAATGRPLVATTGETTSRAPLAACVATSSGDTNRSVLPEPCPPVRGRATPAGRVPNRSAPVQPHTLRRWPPIQWGRRLLLPRRRAAAGGPSRPARPSSDTAGPVSLM